MKKRWEVIEDLIKENKFTKIVEIGVFKGKTCKYLLNNVDIIEKYYAIDPWKIYNGFYGRNIAQKGEKIYKNFLTKIESFKDKIEVLRMTSEEAVNHVGNDIDLVFIDGNHKYEFVKKDIELWYPKVKEGGIFGGHDYYVIEDIKKAVDENFENIMFKDHDTWWVRK